MNNVLIIISSMREGIDEHYLSMIDYVIGNLDLFVKWSIYDELMLPNIDRSIKYHKYPDILITTLKSKNIPKDSRSNGPAITAYRLAGGIRPDRKKLNRQWTIHHIYDRQFPWPGRNQTLHAVKDGNHFTRSAGLVAIHPIADALADEYAYFAWILRWEAFKRFGYDPDCVFV